MEETQGTSVEQLLALEDDVLIRQCEVDHYRAQGPGGQKRNKTSSAVRLRHLPTGLATTAAEDRSQHVNRIRALRRLRGTIALQLRTPVDLERYSASELLASFIGRDGRLNVGRRDHRYCQVVREVLDVFLACGAGARDTAQHLGLTTGHLISFFGQDPKLWERVNQMRAAAGLKALR